MESSSSMKKFKQTIWVITILSFLYFLYKVINFSITKNYYDFELDEITTPTFGMVVTYSIGALVGAAVIPFMSWLLYLGVLRFNKREKKIRVPRNVIEVPINAETNKQPLTIKFTLSSKVKQYVNSIDSKIKNLIFAIWILFHVFLLIISDNSIESSFRYPFEWEGFWIFDRWSVDYGLHYDLFEFTLYVIIPLIFVLGRKYLNGELFKSNSPELQETIVAPEINNSIDKQINDLKKMKELLDLGVISEEEFTEFKKKLMNL